MACRGLTRHRENRAGPPWFRPVSDVGPESELDAVTWWEAHVPLCISLAFLEIVNYNPHAALQLCMEFGHDTDSYAQVVGAFAGAMYGSQIFDQSMIDQVNMSMKDQYNQNVDDWMDLLIPE